MSELFAPAALGPARLRNRIIKAATFEGTTSDAMVTDAERIVAVDYFGVVSLLDSLLPGLRNGNNPAAVVVSSVAAMQLSWQENPIAPA